MENVIERIEILDCPSAINCADQVSKQMIEGSNVSDAMSGETKEYVEALSNTFPTLSASITQIESKDVEKQCELAKRFLKTVAQLDQRYADIVADALENPHHFEPITMMIIAAAVVFVLQTEFHVSYKDGKLDIDVKKKATSEDLLKKIIGCGGP